MTIVEFELQCGSHCLTANDSKQDLITHGFKPLSMIWDCWTLVLLTRGRRHPLENTAIQMWHGYAREEYAM